MASLCDIRVRISVRVGNFSKTTRPRDMLFFLKDTSSIEDEKLFKACSRHADLYIQSLPPTKIVKISTLYHNLLIDYCRDVSIILHTYTSSQVDSLK